ncbi:unnamed protein product [Rhodiola kirilowii]
MGDSRIQTFDGTQDYSIWKVKLQALLTREKCWKAVTQEWASPTSDEKKKEMQEQAHAEIMMKLSNDIIMQVVSITDPKLLWDKLDEIFLSKSLPSKISLLCRLFNFKMNQSWSIPENLDIFLKLTQDLARCEEPIKETFKVVILLNALPSQFDNLKDVIQYGRDEITLTKIIEAITQKNETLRVFKTKTAPKVDGKTEPKTEVMVFKNKKKWQGKSRKPNDSSPSSSTEKVFDKSNVKCTYCKKSGHFTKDCYKLKKKEKETEKDKGKGKQTANQDFSNICESGASYKHEIMMCADNSIASSWILDSGCTIHATSDKSLFCSLKHVDGGDVMLGDNTSLQIKGIGQVTLHMFDGVFRTITGVAWVPHLRRSLLSESKFDKQGCHIVTHNGVKEFIRDNRVLIKCINKGGLYHVVCSPKQINFTNNQDKTELLTELWHSRLGHIGNKGLSHLAKSGVIKDKLSYLKFCENCILGKKTRNKIKPSTFTAARPLEYVHSDLWGPAQVSTVGGRNYFLSLIDQFSRKVWVCLLKTKDEAFETFKTWKTMVENQTDLKLKCLRTDNGLEFCKKAFNEFCNENGIKRHLTVPYTPQQNGTAERMNRTLLEKSRCMLISAGFKPSMWGEAVITASYLINRSPCSALNFKTPQEMWTGKPPNLEHLRPFGCTMYVRTSQGKLNPRAEKGAF